MLSQTLTTNYPPRSDLTRKPGIDTEDVDRYRSLNPFDAVSQAMPKGGRLKIACAPTKDGRVEIRVSDTGVGIPPENLARIVSAALG